MSTSHHSHSGLALRVGRLPWLLFLFLTVVFFLNYHDLSHAKRAIDNYNLSADDIILNADKGSVVHEVSVLSIGIFAIISLVSHRTNRSLRFDGLLGWILVGFTVWSFISIIWADDFLLTIRKLVGFGILCLAAVAVVRRLSLREIIVWTFFTTAIFLVIGVFAEVLFGTFQPFTSGYRFAGSLHPIGEGIECGLLLLSAVAAAEIERGWRVLCWAFALFGLVFLVLSGSRTELVAALLAFVIYFAAVRPKGAKIAMACSSSMIVCLLLFLIGSGLFPNLKGVMMLGRDDDPSSINALTGRTMVWEDVGYYIHQRPVLGYGYGGFWTPTHIRAISDEEQWGVPDGHSAYIDYLLNLGTVGLVAYTLLLGVGIWRAFHIYRRSHNSVFAFCGAFLVFCAIDGLLESAIGERSLLMFLCMVILIRLAVEPLQQNLQVGSRSGSVPENSIGKSITVPNC